MPWRNLSSRVLCTSVNALPTLNGLQDKLHESSIFHLYALVIPESHSFTLSVIPTLSYIYIAGSNRNQSKSFPYPCRRR